MTNIFKHSEQYFQNVEDFNELRISSDFKKIYNKNHVCIIGNINIPYCKDDELYKCTLSLEDNILSTNIAIDSNILENKLKNGEMIPDRKNLFKLLRRNIIYNKLNVKEIIKELYNRNKIKKNTTDLENDNIKWLNNFKNYRIKCLKKNIIKLGNYYIDTNAERLYSESNNDTHQFITIKGGVLIDFNVTRLMNSMINNCINNYKFNLTNIKNYNNFYIKSSCNLIICNQCQCNAWKEQILMNNSNMNVIIINKESQLDNMTYNDILKFHFVVLSIKFINNFNYKNIISQYKFNNQNTEEIYNSYALELFLDNDFLNRKKPILQLIYWNNIIFSDCYDILNITQSHIVSQFIKTFKCNNRWCLISKINIDLLEDSQFKNIISLITENYIYPDYTIISDKIIKYLIKINFINYKTNISDNIIWLNFSEFELKHKENSNSIQFKRKICNSLQINTKGDILFESNLKQIKSLIQQYNRDTKNYYIKKNINKTTNSYGDNSYSNNLYCNNINFNLNDICSICLNEFKEMDICFLNCGHVFCYKCILNSLLFNNKCPKCRKTISYDSIFLLNNTNKKIFYGTKLNYILNIINQNSDKKILVISQFNDVLNKIKEILKKFNVNSKLYDDKINNKNISENNIFLYNSLFKYYPIFQDISLLIILDPLYCKKEDRNLQEKKIINSIKSKNLKITRTYMLDSSEEDIILKDNINKNIKLIINI